MVNLENKVQEESAKKTWVSPEMEEVRVNGGGSGSFEDSTKKVS
jgi:hypothetical protein